MTDLYYCVNVVVQECFGGDAMQWKFTGNKSVYIQIMEHIRGAILMGEYPPGIRIPPVREFAAQAQVNPNTMQRALLELEREGVLVARGTTGRYVTNDKTILDAMRQSATDAIVQAAAAQFRMLGLDMKQAAAMLLALDKKEESCE